MKSLIRLPSRLFVITVLMLGLIGCMTTQSSGGSEEAYLARIKHNPTAAYHYAIGVLYSLEGNLAGAIGEYKKALQMDPDSAYLTSELAAAHLAKNETDQALKLCLDFLERHPHNVDIRLVTGNIYRQLKNYEKAITEYGRIITLEEDNVTALMQLGILYGETNRLAQALATFQKIIDIKPDNLLAAFYSARCYLQMKQLPEAEHWLRRSLEIRPHFESALLDLADLYERQKKNGEAIEIYLTYLNYYPHVTKIRLHLADLYSREKLYERAEEELLKAQEIDGKDREALMALGLFYYERGRYKQARDILTDYLSDHPGDVRARYLLATCNKELKDNERALAEYRKIPPESELFTNSRIQMALIIDKGGQSDEAIKVIEEAMLKKSHASLYAYLGSLYEKKRQYEVAERILLDGLGRFPKNFDLLYALGMLYEKTDRFELALKQMEIILAEDPNNAEALNFIGYCWADRGINLDEAERLIKRALELKPGSGHIIDSLGWVYFRQGKIELAIRYLEEALKIIPDDPIIAEHLGDAYQKNGQLAEAADKYRLALQLNPDNEALKEKLSALQKRLAK